MLNIYTLLVSLSTRLFQSFLLIIVFVFCSPSQVAGQTLYDYAVEMDSLYDRLKLKDESAAKPFFEVFRKAAKLEPNYPVERLTWKLNDINLFRESNYAYKLYSLSKGIEQDSLSIFYVQRDSLRQIIFSLANIKEGEADYILHAGGNYEDVLEYEGDLNSLSKTTRLQITRLSIAIEFLSNKIAVLNGWRSDGPTFSQEEEVLNMLPLGVEMAGPSTSPIIIQNQVGGSAESAIIDGTAKWIAERMRQELSIAFFDRFEAWAENENISLLFPNTISVLKSSATTDYTLMMEIYKRAFEKDLNQLTFNIPAFLGNEIIDEAGNQQLLNEIAELNHAMQKRDFANGIIDGYDLDRRDSTTLVLVKKKSFFQKQLQSQQAIKYLNVSLQAVNRLQEGLHPSILLNTLYNQSDELFPQNKRLKSSLLLLNVISQSLTAINPEKNTVWIGKEGINRLRTDGQLRKFYFSLLRYQVKAIISTELNRQEKIVNNAMPEGPRKEMEEMLEIERSLLREFIDEIEESISVFYYPTNIAISRNNGEGIEETVEDYYQKKFPTDSMPQMKAKFRTALELLLYSDNYSNYLFETRQVTIDDRVLADSLIVYLNLSTEYNQRLVGLLSRPALSNYHVDGWTRLELNFYYYCYREPTFEAAKKAFSRNTGYETIIDNSLKPEFNNPKYRSIAHSIQTLRLKKRYELFEKYGKNNDELTYHKLKSEFIDYLESEIIEKDKIEFIHQQNLQDSAYLQAKLKLNELEKQKDFLDEFIVGANQNFGQFFSRFVQYTNKIDQINAQFKELRSSDQANFGNPEFIYLIKNSMGILDLIFDYTVDKNNPEMVHNMEIIQFATNNLLDAYIAGLSEDYNGMVMNIIPVVEKLVANKYEKLITPLENELRLSLSKKEVSMGLLPPSKRLDSLRQLRDEKVRKMQEVFKYCTFIAAVAKSKDSEDVKKAINAIALPIGSYSIKRRTYANISLNAYPGITGGFELVQNNNFSEWAPNFGFTAPIGISFNWGYRGKINKMRYRNSLRYRNRVQKAEIGADKRIFNGQSGSFFFSIVDLGALVLFRLNDSNEPLPEEVGLKQILSPGVAYVHGLPRVPISIMAGAQMTPDLRKVGEGVNSESANSFRFNLSLVMDLPIVNFYTRRRPKR